MCVILHTVSGVANLRCFFCEEISVTKYARFKHQKVLVYEMKNMRYDEDAPHDHNVYDDNKDMDRIRSDHFVNSFAMV